MFDVERFDLPYSDAMHKSTWRTTPHVVSLARERPIVLAIPIG